MSAYHIISNKMRTVRMLDVKPEIPKVKSFIFNDKLCANAEPGQFAMVWIPSVDEVPMSLSFMNPTENKASITVQEVGEATRALHKMRRGDLFGVRGPLGTSYDISGVQKVMIVGGGTGLASLAPLAECLAKKKAEVTLLMGAKTRSGLLFLDPMKRLISKAEGDLIATTEDGSYGLKGLVTTHAEELLKESTGFDMIYSCGPEQMMHKMLLLTEKFEAPFQASLERFMRCAIGLCGTCVIGRYQVCKDGPVFSGEQLRGVKDEFGHFRRGFDGRKTIV